MIGQPVGLLDDEAFGPNSYNPCMYVNNNPINYTDPSGLAGLGSHPKSPCPKPWKAKPTAGLSWQYGCYCGEEPVPPRPPGSIPPPIDELDKCCKTHDGCYGNPKKTVACCDKELAECAQNILAKEKNPTQDEIKAAGQISGYFEPKGKNCVPPPPPCG